MFSECKLPNLHPPWCQGIHCRPPHQINQILSSQCRDPNQQFSLETFPDSHSIASPASLNLEASLLVQPVTNIQSLVIQFISLNKKLTMDLEDHATQNI